MERAGLNYFGPCQPQTLPRLLGASQAQDQGLRVGGQVSHLSSLPLPADLPSVPSFQSRIPGPPPRLGARGGASPSIPSSGRGSDRASGLGSGPQGPGPGPHETPAARVQGPPPRGGGCGRLGAGAQPRSRGAGQPRVAAALGVWEPRGGGSGPCGPSEGRAGGPSASWAIGNGLLGGSGGAGPGRKTLE